MLEHVPHVDGEVLNDEMVIIHSSSFAGEPKVFEPYTRIRFPGVFGDVGGWSEALWERRFLDATAKGPWSQSIQARTLVVWSAIMPGVRVPTALYGLAEARAACSRCPLLGIIIMPGLMPIIDDAASVTVRSEQFAHRCSVWSGSWVGLRCSHGFLPHARQLLW